MSQISLYGISNCDQVRKAKRLLKDHQIDFVFHDFRKDGLSEAMLQKWFIHVPWDALLNRRGTTWRKMPETVRATIVDQRSAQEAMLAEPTLIKRPVLTAGNHVLVGFSQTIYLQTLNLDEKPRVQTGDSAESGAGNNA